MIDILIIGGVDVSDYVLVDGIQFNGGPILHQIEDLDKNTHSKLVNDKDSLSATLGTVPHSVLKALRRAIVTDNGKVEVNIFGDIYTMTSMQAAGSSQYIDGDTPMWHNVTITGVEA